jgi:hypothetical protein
MEKENQKILINHRILPNERVNYSLIIDAVYCADKVQAKTLKGEVMSKLLGVGNAGGFRICGSVTQPKFVMIFTSGEDIYWRDQIDNSLGIFLYYGDNKTPGRKLTDTKPHGNQMLETIFGDAFSEKLEVRKKIPPVFIFKKEEGRDVKFLGLAVPGIQRKDKKEWLTAVWGITKSGDRFQNYRALFTVLDTSDGSQGQVGSDINLAWLNDIEKGKAYESIYAPYQWKNYIDDRNYKPLVCTGPQVPKNREEQLPADPEGMRMLQTIHDYFNEKDHGYSFEPFANDIARGMNSSIFELITTPPYRDGGVDGVGKYRLFTNAENDVFVDFFLQAKCYGPDTAVGVSDMARLISRIRDRQFGIMFTTSYIGNQAYEELIHDRHPIILITGKDIISFIRSAYDIESHESLADWLKKRY